MSETEEEAPPVEEPTPPEEPGLREGSRGDAVHALQIRLGVPADCVYGPMTANAVRAVQRAAKLPETGVANERTHGILGLKWPEQAELS